jgi:hypothetical protein
MAIYHLNVKTGSRGNGQSAGAKDDYIEREGKYEKKHGDVLLSESGNMPYWAQKKPSEYWKAADIYERSNGRLYKEIEFALPVELSDEQKIQAVRQYASYITKGENLPYTWAIHNNDPNNPHCHLMVSERANDNAKRPRARWFSRYNNKEPRSGGARKTDKLKPKEWIESARMEWANIANSALKESGFENEKIDHRSFEGQGIEKPKPVHLGTAAWQMEMDRTNKEGAVTRAAIMTDRGNRKREADMYFRELREYNELEILIAEGQKGKTAKPAEPEQPEGIVPSAPSRATYAELEGRRGELAAKLKAEAQKIARPWIAEAERRQIEIEAGKIKAENASIYKRYCDAFDGRAAHDKEEPPEPLIFGRGEWKRKHEAWEGQRKANQRLVEALWEKVGGNMSRKAGGYGKDDVQRRLTDEYALEEAEKRYRKSNQRHFMAQELNDEAFQEAGRRDPEAKGELDEISRELDGRRIDRRIAELDGKLENPAYSPGSAGFSLLADYAREVIQLEQERGGVDEREAERLHPAAAAVLEEHRKRDLGWGR